MNPSSHTQTEPSTAPLSCGATDYDAVIIGGAFSGASSALLLKRWRPTARILIVETRDHGERKVGEVGEATVEVSGCFLHRVLGLYDHLSREHLPKHGLRYWFTDGPDRLLREMSEVGPAAIPPLPSFQLDRARLDEHLLELAEAEGCEVLRPASVKAVELTWPASVVELETAGGGRRVTTRWVLDGSGRRAFLARRLGLRKRIEEHPVAASWGRWRGVLDLDGPEVMGNGLEESAIPPMLASRRLATNHFCGYGWWCWVIPLAGGRTSIGLVYNKQLVELPEGASPEERYRRFIRSQPGLRELLADAEPESGDFMAYSHLPYRSSAYMGRGWALLGDAASFLDPFYSPGLDHASISVYATARLVIEDLETLDEAALDAHIETHNARFLRSYDRWLEALYLDKYELMGDAQLMGCAFLVDTSLYYLGVVTPVYLHTEALANPLFGLPGRSARWAYRIMRTFNRRMVSLARSRRRLGIYGRRNIGWRAYAPPFGLRSKAVRPLLMGLRLWLRLELESLAYRLRPRRRDAAVPASVPAKS